jgi:hypothetical protein
MARIYIETTIASFYHEERSEPEMLARRNWTRRWFDAARAGSDQLVTSLAVEAELRGGNFPHRDAALALIAELPLIDLDESVAEIVDAYIAHRLMPCRRRPPMNSLTEVRRIRREMSKAAGHDVRRLIATINASREKETGRIISPGFAAETVSPAKSRSRQAEATTARLAET